MKNRPKRKVQINWIPTAPDHDWSGLARALEIGARTLGYLPLPVADARVVAEPDLAIPCAT